MLAEWYDNGCWPVSVTDVGRRTGLSRSVVFKHLKALTREGVIEQGPSFGWRPVQR